MDDRVGIVYDRKRSGRNRMPSVKHGRGIPVADHDQVDLNSIYSKL